MHSSIYFISQNKKYNSFISEDTVFSLMTSYVDYVTIDSDQEQKDNIKWLSETCPEFKIKSNSFTLTEKSTKKLRDDIYRNRKNNIETILKKDLTLQSLYEIADAAKPKYEMMFMHECNSPIHVEDFILEHPPLGKYYILKTYDYHF